VQSFLFLFVQFETVEDLVGGIRRVNLHTQIPLSAHILSLLAHQYLVQFLYSAFYCKRMPYLVSLELTPVSITESIGVFFVNLCVLAVFGEARRVILKYRGKFLIDFDDNGVVVLAYGLEFGSY